MRLKSAIWVAAYMRQCQNAGAFVAVRQRGHEDAGAIFIKINHLNGKAELFGPSPQTVFDDARPSDRAFINCFDDAQVSDAKAEDRIAQEMKYDPDIWVIEVEDREGRTFLDWVVKN